MKIRDSISSRSGRRKDGMAVIVILALLALVLALIAANTRAIAALGGELKVIDQKQIRRLNRSASNAPAPAALNTNLLLTAQAAKSLPQ